MEVSVANVVLRADGLVNTTAGRSLLLQLLRGEEIVAEAEVDPETGFADASLVVQVPVPIVDGQADGRAMAEAVASQCGGLRYVCFIAGEAGGGAQMLCEGAAEGLGLCEEGPVAAQLDGLVSARLTGYFRVSVQLPSLLSEQAPPLALNYFSIANRSECMLRLAQWREEMCATALHCENPGLGASLRWERTPPVKPSRTLGDATTQAVRGDYARGKNEDRITISRQAVQRDYDTLHAGLLRCVTALQAHTKLQEMRAYALMGANLKLLDADLALQKLRKVRLPFERLVRNVWSAGPETKYDASKASLEKLLETEAAERAAADAAMASTGHVPRQLVSEIVHSLPRAQTPGAGLGLVTFQGSMRTHPSLPAGQRAF